MNEFGEAEQDFSYEHNAMHLERCYKSSLASTWETPCQCKCNPDKFINKTYAEVLSETGIIRSLVFYDANGNPLESLMNVRLCDSI
jgi:hypothetical protein